MGHGRTALAEKAYAQSQRINPESEGAWCGLARCYEEMAMEPALTGDLQKMVEDGSLTAMEASVMMEEPAQDEEAAPAPAAQEEQEEEEEEFVPYVCRVMRKAIVRSGPVPRPPLCPSFL